MICGLAPAMARRPGPGGGAVDGHFVEAGARDVTGERDQLGGRGRVLVDGGDGAEGLGVVDHGGAAEEAVVGGEGRLVAGDGALTLDGVEDHGLLAADVAAGADADVELQVEGTVPGAAVEDAGLAGLVEGALEGGAGGACLAVDVDVGALEADGVVGEEDAFDEAVGIALEEVAVLEDAGFAFLGVDDEHAGLAGVGGGEPPLGGDGEVGAAAAGEASLLDGVEELLGRRGEGAVERDVGALGEDVAEGAVVAAEAGGEAAAAGAGVVGLVAAVAVEAGDDVVDAVEVEAVEAAGVGALEDGGGRGGPVRAVGGGLVEGAGAIAEGGPQRFDEALGAEGVAGGAAMDEDPRQFRRGVAFAETGERFGCGRGHERARSLNSLAVTRPKSRS